MASDKRGKYLRTDHIPDDEVARLAEWTRAELEKDRKRREDEWRHTIEVLEFDAIRKRLASHTVGAPARLRAEQWMPAFMRSEAVIRQEETASALRMIRRKGPLPLPVSGPTPGLIRQAAQGSVLTLKDLLQTGQFLTAVRRLTERVPDEETREALAEKETDDPAVLDPLRADEPLYRLLDALVPLEDLETAIVTAILSEDEVADDASPELLSIRRQIKQQQASIREHLDRIIRNHERALQEQLVTMRGDRYVVPVKASYRGEIRGLVHDTSASGQTLFIEPMTVVEANNAVTELRAEEREEIFRIRQHLSAAVGSREQVMLDNVEQVTALDLISARARLAEAMEATMPSLNDEGRILLKRARHPLINPDEVVPIDFRIGEDYRTLVITGPNTGGKTVTLKTCGLLTVMGMAGLHIPAEEGSELGFFPQVLADIGDEQSIEQSLSTFSAHMRNLVRITELADHESLVLADELGSGTDPSEGAALAQAILNHLRKRGATTVATTHYKELKAYAMETEGVENASCEFDIKTLQPTFRLLIGVPGVSHAFTISQKLGLSSSIIDSAKAFLTGESIRFESLIRSIEEDRRALDTMKDELEQRETELQRTRRRVEDDQRKVEKRLSDLNRQELEARRKMLEDKRAAIEQLMKEIRSEQVQSRFDRAASEGEALREMVAQELGEVERAITDETIRSLKDRGEEDRSRRPKQVEVGETYYAPSLNFEGKVLTEPDKNGEVQLEAGVLRVNVPVSELRYPKGADGASDAGANRASRRRAAASGGTGGGSSPRRAARQNFRPEIKLLGYTVDDALHAVDEYLDQAVLAGAEKVRIVHGKGTGALRSAIGDALKGDRRVASYGPAPFGQGDAGVTVVTLA